MGGSQLLMFVQELGLEHLRLAKAETDIWEGSVQLCGSGTAFVLTKSNELSNAITVASDGPFRIVAKRKDGTETTVFGRECD